MAKQLTLMKYTAEAEARRSTARQDPFSWAMPRIRPIRATAQAAKQEEIDPELVNEGPDLQEPVFVKAAVRIESQKSRK